MIQPTNKYFMEDYRRVLGTNDAPQMIDTQNPIIPVALINNGLPKPLTSQQIKLKSFNKGASHTSDNQIATVNANMRVYYLGYYHTGLLDSFVIEDSISGTAVLTDGDTNILAEWQNGAGATNINDFVFLPLPIEVKQGIRLSIGTNAGGSSHITVIYIEELKN